MNKLYLIFLLFFISCKSTNQTNNSKCNENLEFKEKFFSNIDYIEKNVAEVQDAKFKNTLIFLSNYVTVSLERAVNYANTYPIGIFEEDKKGWLEWYSKNKCNNIILK